MKEFPQIHNTLRKWPAQYQRCLNHHCCRRNQKTGCNRQCKCLYLCSLWCISHQCRYIDSFADQKEPPCNCLEIFPVTGFSTQKILNLIFKSCGGRFPVISQMFHQILLVENLRSRRRSLDILRRKIDSFLQLSVWHKIRKRNLILGNTLISRNNQIKQPHFSNLFYDWNRIRDCRRFWCFHDLIAVGISAWFFTTSEDIFVTWTGFWLRGSFGFLTFLCCWIHLCIIIFEAVAILTLTSGFFRLSDLFFFFVITVKKKSYALASKCVSHKCHCLPEKNFSAFISCQTIAGKSALFQSKLLTVLFQYRSHIGFKVIIYRSQI